MGEFKLAADFDPHYFTTPHGAGQDSVDRKAPPPTDLYPNLADYMRIDLDRYSSHEQMAREWDKMWTRVWTCAGRAEDIAKPGSYFRYDLGRESFIIVRGRDNKIRALYNACQHRGRQLVDDDCGSKSLFVCPFHSWAYDLEGKNVRVTDREGFDANALCGSLDLKEARCETWGGFVFVNMNPSAPPLLDFLSDLPELMAAYQMEDMHVIQDVTVEIPCNWKSGIEAFLETYHVHITHPQTLPGVDDVYDQIDIYRNGHGRVCTPFSSPSPRVDGEGPLHPFMAAFIANAGLDPEKVVASKADIRDAIYRAKLSPDNPFGLDYSGFTKSQVLDIWAYSAFPNFTLNAHPEGVLCMLFLPHATDPHIFYFRAIHIVAKLRPDAKLPFYMGIEDSVDISGKTRPPRTYAPADNPGLGLVMEQDIANLRGVNKGIQSRGFEGNRYAKMETRLQVLHAELDLYLKGAK